MVFKILKYNNGLRLGWGQGEIIYCSKSHKKLFNLFKYFFRVFIDEFDRLFMESLYWPSVWTIPSDRSDENDHQTGQTDKIDQANTRDISRTSDLKL